MKNKKNLIAYASVFAFLLAILCIVLNVLFNSSETYISNTEEDARVDLLYCSATSPEETFLTLKDIISPLHEIKVISQDDIINKIAYSLSGNYQNNIIAEQAKTNMDIEFGQYMSKNGMSSDILNRKSSVVDTTLYFNLVGDGDVINSVTAPVFFMDEEVVNDFNELSLESLLRYYTSKSFTCEIKK